MKELREEVFNDWRELQSALNYQIWTPGQMGKYHKLIATLTEYGTDLADPTHDPRIEAEALDELKEFAKVVTAAVDTWIYPVNRGES